MDNVERQVPALQGLPAQVAELGTQIGHLRADFDAKLSATAVDLRTEVQALREETRQEFRAVRVEMQEGFQAVRGEMRQLNEETASRSATVRTKPGDSCACCTRT